MHKIEVNTEKAAEAEAKLKVTEAALAITQVTRAGDDPAGAEVPASEDPATREAEYFKGACEAACVMNASEAKVFLDAACAVLEARQTQSKQKIKARTVDILMAAHSLKVLREKLARVRDTIAAGELTGERAMKHEELRTYLTEGIAKPKQSIEVSMEKSGEAELKLRVI